MADAPLLAAVGLVGEVLQIERARGPLQPDVELRDLTLGEEDDAYAGEPRQQSQRSMLR
jgi:hypothetical protein